MSDRVPAESAIGDSANISRHVALMAAARPGAPALKIPRGHTARGDIDYLTLTFAELDQEVALWCERLAGAGVRRGDRTLVMVRQGLPLIASVFALFRMGSVPVVIDPGMGMQSFLACVSRSRPHALVGIPLAQWMSRLFRRAFSSVKIRVSASSVLTARLGGGIVKPAPSHVAEVNSASTELAAVLFTSGSTGAPKGVCYEHGMFDAQVRLIREAYGIERGEIDLPLLPIFALFNPALGMTTIVPEIDPRRPASLDPAKIIRAIQQENVTNSFGSPTLWGKLGEYCGARNITLPSLRRVLCAGAPVPARLWTESRRFLPNGKLHSPYGATEALPVATISSEEIEAGSLRGACVGTAIRGIDVKIIAITDQPIATIGDVRELRPGEIGEIIVRGAVVTKTYDALPDATRSAKIQHRVATDQNDGSPLGTCPLPLVTSDAARAASASVWHRMGDCGYRDANGRLWFCGRKAERVETASRVLHTEPCEQVFRQHPRAARCALVGLGERARQEPAIVVEARVGDASDAQQLADELRALGAGSAHTSGITRFYFRAQFPVDVRHNAKIHRLALAKWAATARGYEGRALGR